MEERLPTSTSLKEWKERRRRRREQSCLKGFGTKEKEADLHLGIRDSGGTAINSLILEEKE